MTGTVTELATPEVRDYWKHVEADDLSGALGAAVSLIEQGWSVTDIVERLLTPTQHHVGQLWADDAWSVSREHAATALNEAVLRRVGTIRRTSQTKPAGAEVLVVCAESEWHALPGLAVTVLLNDQDVPAVFLGADLHVPAVHHETVRLNTRAVVVSASLASSLPYVQRLVEVVRSARVPVVVGGSAFDPDGLRAAALGATAHAERGGALPDVIRALPARVAPLVLVRSAAREEAEQLTARRRDIAAAAMTALTLTSERDWRDFVDDQLPHVLGALEAALIVNDPGAVSQAWDWLEQVLERRGGHGVVEAVRSAVTQAVREFPLASRMLADVAPPR
ncbi:cobalamin B12-binding domain-containing protein [Nocardioidaceae bacterium]|nr:cobalamin B12-binding domain-containing protein [Nocardioidaceae bacterium]